MKKERIWGMIVKAPKCLPRSNNKTIQKGSIPPKATMDIVQEHYNYKGNNSQST